MKQIIPSYIRQEEIWQSWFDKLPINDRKKYYTLLTKWRNNYIKQHGTEVRWGEFMISLLQRKYELPYHYASKVFKEWRKTKEKEILPHWYTCG